VGVIEVRNLHKSYGRTKALNGISFELREGEVFALLGPNGAGKTTTIFIILGLLQADEGDVFVDGEKVSPGKYEYRKKIGAVLEENGIYERLKVRESLQFWGEIYGLSNQEIRRRIEELSEELGIDFLEKRGSELSRGMRQKGSLARALLPHPPILILDEPTDGLDVPARETFKKIVRKERENGKSILYSTHIMAEVEEIADRIAIIHKGNIVTSGTLQELQEKYGEKKLEKIFIRAIGYEL